MQRPETEVRNQVIALLGLMGPATSVRTLQELFPWVARRELEDLAARFRRVHRCRHQPLAYVLRWLWPGTVWAMDFTEPPARVDGTYKAILLVRDLASGNDLLSLPSHAQSAEVVCAALQALFALYGAPLVIKSDNGSAFDAEATRELLRASGVLQLLSPPGTPSYNGSCEAGIGGLKTRAHHEAARHGRPGEWTCDDVEAARCIGNATARPRGHAGPTPDAAWRDRAPIPSHARGALHQTVIRLTTEVGDDLMHGMHSTRPAPWLAASIERIAITRALLEHGHLELRRRRIPLHIPRRRVGKNS
jgi:transposase InsO family protein